MIFLMMIDTPKDKRKFVILYEKYIYLMITVAEGVLHDKFLAEDAVHDAFVKVAKNMYKIRDINSMKTKRFLIVIAKNSAIDIYRKRNIRMKSEIFFDELSDNEAPASFMETDINNSVLDILINLPVKYRDVFLLKYSSKLDNSEIAGLLKIQEGTVRQRLARGKVIIEKALKELEE